MHELLDLIKRSLSSKKNDIKDKDDDLCWVLHETGIQEVMLVLEESQKDKFSSLDKVTQTKVNTGNPGSHYTTILILLKNMSMSIADLAREICGHDCLEGLVLGGAQLTFMKDSNVPRNFHTDPPKMSQLLLCLTLEGRGVLTLRRKSKKLDQTLFEMSSTKGYMLVGDAVGDRPKYQHKVDKVCDSGRYSVLFRFCRS